MEEPALSGTATGMVITVFWAQDGAAMYYATAPGGGLRPLRWFVIDLAALEDRPVGSPPRLDRTPYVSVSGVYSELEGEVSPSGRYELRMIGDQGHVGDLTPVVSSLWLIDRPSGRSTKVFDTVGSVLRGAEWFGDEHAVVLGVGPEFGTDLYILDCRAAKVTPLSEVTGFDDAGLLEWTLSPDGTRVAVVDGQGRLELLPLAGGPPIALDGFFYNVRWQPDGNKLFYYHGPDWFVLETIEVYDSVTGKTRTIATSSQLENQSILGRPFEVSPGGAFLAMWSARQIWLVSQPEG